jgi:hypothetical protein
VTLDQFAESSAGMYSTSNDALVRIVIANFPCLTIRTRRWQRLAQDFT